MAVHSRDRWLAILLILGCGIVGCDSSSSNRGGGTSLSITTGSLPNGALGITYTATVSTDATSGQTLVWKLRGALPTGLNASFGATDATISGTPAATGAFTFTIEADDGNGTTSVTYTVSIASSAVVSITTTSLPGGTVGTSYSQGITATGGNGSYTWSGTNLPAGLSLSSGSPTATLSGTPSAAGTFNFSVDVQDSGGTTDSQSFTITIASGGSPLAITTSSLPDGVVGVAYDQDPAASGGTGTGYTWTSTGTLPTGLSLTDGTPAADLSGTPTTAGSYSFDLTVTDSGSNTDTESYNVTIAPAVRITTATLPDGIVNGAYSETVTAQNGSGAGYAWSLSGNVPPGLSITASATPSATLSGTPSADGSFTFDVTVTDSVGSTDTISYTITVDPELVITTTTVANAVVGQTYSETVTATGGSASGYDWSLSGNVPPGLTVTDATPSGTLDGPVTSAGTYTFDLEVSDSDGNMASQTVTLTASAPPSDPLRLTTFILPNGRVGDMFSEEIVAADGAAGSPTFSVSSGSLPTGLVLNQPTGGSKTATITGMPSTDGHFQYTITADDGVTTASHQYRTTIAIAPRWVVYRADILTSAVEELFAVDISSGTPGAPFQLDPGTDITLDNEYRFSWDGRLLAYIDSADIIWTIDMSGATPGTPQRVIPATAAGGAVAFQFSMDDRYIVFHGDLNTAGDNELFAVDISGGAPYPAPVTISDAPISSGSTASVTFDDLDTTTYTPGLIYGSFSPPTFRWGTFSPDGNWLVYEHDNVTVLENDLFLIDFSGATPGSPQRVAANARAAGTDMKAFVWSADSRYLAFVADWNVSLQDELYVVDTQNLGTATQVSAPMASTSTALDVVSTVGYYSGFYFSPDVTSLVYRADDQTDNEFNLFHVSFAGGTPGAAVQVNGTLPTSGDVDGVFYSPDSRWLAYRSDERVNNESELWVVDITGGVLGSKEVVSHDPIAANGDVDSLSTFDRNIQWASEDFLIFVGDTDVNDDSSVYSVDVSGGMPFPDPVQLNAPLPSGGDVAAIGVLPDGERVVVIGDIGSDGLQEMYMVFISNPGTNHLLSSPVTTAGLEVEDTWDNDQGCFFSPGLRWVISYGDFSTSSADDMELQDISGSPPYPQPLPLVNSPASPSSSQEVTSYHFSP